MKKILLMFFAYAMLSSSVFAQFGQNKVNYKDFDWYYIQTKHFDIYFVKGAEKIAEFTAAVSEEAVRKIQEDISYQLNNRISLIVYDSHNDFQETNITDEYFSRGTGGFTEPFKNRVVFPFEGSYKKFQHVIAHELVHAVMRDMYYGGTIQNIIAKGITLQLPTWFWEGSAEYLSQGWETNTDMFIRNSINTENMPDINQLSGYYAYRGGQALFRYIAETYGRQKIGELMNKVQGSGSLESAFKAAIGIGIEELNERWKKSLKKEFWPDVAVRQDPDEFAKRLTDNNKVGGFYNTSPALSPQGDKIAFISDRDVYLDVYVMDANDGKILKKIVSSGKTTDFEELTVLHPSLTWSPDNISVALSSKSGGYDVIRIVNTETEESQELPFKMPGIESVSWSNDRNKIAFVGHNESQSDIYIYDLATHQLTNLTNDIFSDTDPVWTPDSKKIIFTSDRQEFLTSAVPDSFSMAAHSYKQLDLYMMDVTTKKIERLTDWQLSDEKYPIVSADGKEVLFVSDKNGINNIYRMKLVADKDGKFKTANLKDATPITNSISDLTQISTSADGKKLVFTALYKLGYNVFMITNPFESEPEFDSIKTTNYMLQLISEKNKKETQKITAVVLPKDTLEIHHIGADSTAVKSTEIFTGQYVSKKKEKADSAATDYSKYVFVTDKSESDSARIAKRNELFHETLDKNNNFLVNHYKIDFTPDLIYANAGYSTLYGLLGTTVLSFSDLLGNHRIIGQTSLQVDIKNSDYGFAYYYLKERLDLGFEGFHTARFLYRTGSTGQELYRFTNFTFTTSASYPFDRFHRIDFGLSVMSVTADNMDNIYVPSEKSTFTIPSMSYVKDNVMWGYTSPIEGTRYFIRAFGDPGFIKKRQSFYSIVFDYRKYLRFFYDNCFVFRFSGGYSGGGNPQRFFIGGTENWINRDFATTDVPVTSAADFAFLSPALPLRGYDYAQRLGTKYGLLNLELRVPIIRYLLTGGLPLFFQNILGTMFIDAGSAWDKTDNLKLLGRNENGKIVTQDLLIGTGAGFRFSLIFIWRLDIAWKYNFDSFSKPRYLLSIGLDF